MKSQTISLCLIGTGAIAWAFTGRPLVNDRELKVPLNPLGINGSPYGEVIAMAMQGPIERYADIGMNGVGHVHGAAEECSGSDHEGHDHAAGETCSADEHDHHDDECDGHEGHDHDDGEICEAHGHEDVPQEVAGKVPGLTRRFEKFLTTLGGLPHLRTNPNAAGERLRVYLRREAENKLRFAYQLDPANYGNYVVLHFFLSEPTVGTRRQLTSDTVKLANDTIAYCMKQDSDPRPALTAAAAATNVLELMFEDQHKEKPTYNTTHMRECLDLADACLTRYVELSKQWQENHHWELISPQRIEECADRFQFIVKIRDSAEAAILRMEDKTPAQAGKERGSDVSEVSRSRES